MKRAHTSCSSDSPTLYPHVFISAAMAFQQLRTNGKNQSVLISGESGGENISIPDLVARIYLQTFLIWLSELRLFAYETLKYCIRICDITAGKTETTKKVLAFLANVAPALGRGKSEVGMETKILQSNPLLEALGNAKTLRNGTTQPTLFLVTVWKPFICINVCIYVHS